VTKATIPARFGGLSLFRPKVAMTHNSDLSRGLFETGVAVFVIAPIFGLSVSVGLFFHYI
jgi:hypothetical protein